MCIERCGCESNNWLVSLLVVSTFLGERQATWASSVSQQDSLVIASAADRLFQSTDRERQEILLKLCVTLDEGRQPPRIDHIVRAVLPLVQDRDSITRSLAVEVLSRVGEAARPAVPALIRVLRDRETCAGLRAVMVLANLGEPAMQPLMDALKEEDVIVRQLAASALGQMGPRATAALPALHKARDAAREDVVRERLDIAIKRISNRDQPEMRR